MANQISKEAILEFLNKRLESTKHRIEELNSMKGETLAEKANLLRMETSNVGKLQFIEILISNIERGAYDEERYVVEPNGAMIDKRLYSDINYSL
jgi:hypothetical protein